MRPAAATLLHLGLHAFLGQMTLHSWVDSCTERVNVAYRTGTIIIVHVTSIGSARLGLTGVFLMAMLPPQPAPRAAWIPVETALYIRRPRIYHVSSKVQAISYTSAPNDRNTLRGCL